MNARRRHATTGVPLGARASRMLLPAGDAAHRAGGLACWQPIRSVARRTSALLVGDTLIDGMLRPDLNAPPDQRHTTQRTFDRLDEDHEARAVSYSVVRLYAKDRRKEIRRHAEAS
ncbi:hypothetical protein RB200_35325 [Streptomyces sp. PmtG]